MPRLRQRPTPHEEVSLVLRRQIVAERYLRGEYQSQIAQALGITQQQISQDLKVVRAAWLASTLRDFDALKSEQLAKVDAVEVEAWDAWARSKQPREVTVTEQTEGASATRKASVRREGQAGDPRFLERIQKCIEQRCDILGLHAPKRYKFDWETLSDRQLERLAAGDDPLAVMAEA